MRLQRFKIDEKRVMFPFTAVSMCPGCGVEVRFAGEVNFPTFGGKSTLYALCPNDACDYAAQGLTVEVVLDVQVEPAHGSAIVRIEHESHE